MAEGELILYQTDDGLARFYLKEIDGSVWMSQAEIAELYQSSKQSISLHIKNIYEDNELSEEATVKENLTVQTEGARQVSREIKLYNLEVILAIGYRVRSDRGIQFRKWATAALSEYMIKGFVMDDERLKNPDAWDYFDELLERIRDIRASEKRFYQKIRDLFALSEDYKDDQNTRMFFAEAQNKMLHAVTHKTAPELIIDRADASQPNMNLQSWSGGRVRKRDVIVAKNYLYQNEITELNRITTMFLDYAEDRVAQRKTLTLENWRENIDKFLDFNERPVLKGAGKITRTRADQIANERYDQFDAARKRQEAIAADAEDLKELEAIEVEMITTKKDGTQ